ncbi:Uncharacterised protein [Enterobacter cloacae]|uniref:Uncharacterized protein n=1 Tax=Enterobacter cloacae TaxID=550 RepID=A0A377LWK0_ENTCL|nr:Uncharacterised protein [Enterobacter cloacae]
MSNTITSADSIFALTVTNLFPSAQTLEGYAADAMFALGDTEMAVSVRGADGKLSGGFVFVSIYRRSQSCLIAHLVNCSRPGN